MLGQQSTYEPKPYWVETFDGIRHADLQRKPWPPKRDDFLVWRVMASRQRLFVAVTVKAMADDQAMLCLSFIAIQTGKEYFRYVLMSRTYLHLSGIGYDCIAQNARNS